MRTVIFAVVGSVVVVGAVRRARRYAVVDRLPARRLRAPLLPRRVAQRLAAALDAAAFDVTPAHAVQLWIAAAFAIAILAAAVAGMSAGAATAIAAGAAGPMVLWTLRGRRSRLVAAAVPVTIDRIASELRAGGTIPTAITAIATGDGALAADFARVDARLQLGATPSEALRAWGDERDASGVDVAAGALAMCAIVGGRAADALDGLSSSLRDRLALVAEARALSAQARMSAIVVGGLPLCYVAWSAVADGDALHALLGTTTGRACVAIGFTLEALGTWWMRRILRSGVML